MKKIIVAGGRDFGRFWDGFYVDEPERNRIEAQRQMGYDVLFRLIGEGKGVEIVSGGAKGADAFGEEYAQAWGIPVKVFPADWDGCGLAGGPRRNRQMAEYADVLIAFWDGDSRGTKNMIQTALKLGLEVHVYRY